MKVAVFVPIVGPLWAEHVVALPVTVHVSVPVGATPVPVTVAVNVRGCPTVRLLCDWTSEMVGFA